MNRPALIILLLQVLFVSCTGHSSKSQDLSSLDLGRDQTAIHGLIQSFSESDEGLLIQLEVVDSRQGGASAPAIAKGAEITTLCTPIFKRVYKDRTGSKIESDISINQEVVMFISKSLRYQNYTVNHLNPISK